ncbi:MAG: hypothetical protein MJ016_08240 [Victivallaceae bacterium]|nr:hypothetical protein [Victivallaceae bacterium]
MKKSIFVAAVASVLAFSLAAEEDMTAPINGSFQGFAFSLAPGWSKGEGDGDASIITGRRNHRELRIETEDDHIQRVVSDAFPVNGKILIVEMESSGRGQAAMTVLSFDAQEQIIDEDEPPIRPVRTGHGRVDAKYYFRFPENAATAQIVLSTVGAADVVFGDLEASFTDEITPEILAGLQPPKPEPEKVSTFDKMQRPTDTVQPVSINDGARLKAEELFDGESYQITLPLGGETEFFLEEDADADLLWKIASFDADKCRIKIRHENVGLWPFDTDVARIAIKAKNSGISEIVLPYGDNELKIKLNIL